MATNIAESSITISDIVYVIDFCLTKEISYNHLNHMDRLELVWASQASCRQRQGRVGRVTNGFAFKLLPLSFYKNKLHKFTTPELLRSPLEKVILRIKLLHENEKDTLNIKQNANFTD